MSNVTLTEKVDKVMSDVKKTLYKVECLRGNIGNLARVGIPSDDPTNIKPFLQDRIYPKIEDIASELNSLMWKLDNIYVEAKDITLHRENVVDKLRDIACYVSLAGERHSGFDKNGEIVDDYLRDAEKGIKALIAEVNEEYLEHNQKYQNLINEIDKILKQHKEKYGES
jgi:hypothetical protein